jgi:hypothetical protein
VVAAGAAAVSGAVAKKKTKERTIGSLLAAALYCILLCGVVLLQESAIKNATQPSGFAGNNTNFTYQRTNELLFVPARFGSLDAAN